jgi:hypothetical protein
MDFLEVDLRYFSKQKKGLKFNKKYFFDFIYPHMNTT